MSLQDGNQLRPQSQVLTMARGGTFSNSVSQLIRMAIFAVKVYCVFTANQTTCEVTCAVPELVA